MMPATLDPIRKPTRQTGDRIVGRDLICFSHDWSGDPLSKTHLMRLLAKDNRVLWVNSIGYRMPTASKSDARRAVKKLLAAAKPDHVSRRRISSSSVRWPSRPTAAVSSGRSIGTLLRWQVRRAMRKS